VRCLFSILNAITLITTRYIRDKISCVRASDIEIGTVCLSRVYETGRKTAIASILTVREKFVENFTAKCNCDRRNHLSKRRISGDNHRCDEA